MKPIKEIEPEDFPDTYPGGKYITTFDGGFYENAVVPNISEANIKFLMEEHNKLVRVVNDLRLVHSASVTP